MTFYELYMELNARFPSALSCEWDNDGIMCACDMNSSVRRVLVSLDVTDKTVNYALENGFDTIISHHPLVFKGQKALTPMNFTQAKLIKLVKGSVNVMSFHTRLDAAIGGVNDALASALELKIADNDPKDPIGRICVLDDAEKISIFAKMVKEKLGAPYVTFIGKNPVKRIYLCGGDGKDMIQNAIACGADTLLTGNASYNSMLDAEENGLNVIEAGHFYTENPVCEALKKILLGLGDSFKIEIFNSNKIEFV